MHSTIKRRVRQKNVALNVFILCDKKKSVNTLMLQKSKHLITLWDRKNIGLYQLFYLI